MWVDLGQSILQEVDNFLLTLAVRLISCESLIVINSWTPESNSGLCSLECTKNKHIVGFVLFKGFGYKDRQLES